MSTTITGETEEITEIGGLNKTTEIPDTTTDIATAGDSKYNIVKRNSKENKIAEELKRQGAGIQFIASGFIDTAKNAKRYINTKDDGIIEVPNEELRYKALRDIAKIEGAFESLGEQTDDFDGNVIFID